MVKNGKLSKIIVLMILTHGSDKFIVPNVQAIYRDPISPLTIFLKIYYYTKFIRVDLHKQ
jgi:hypothetical protein